MSPAQRSGSRKKAADPDVLKDLMYGRGPVKRFTQDSPVMPDVWLAYGENPRARVDLLLTPHIRSSAGELYAKVWQRLREETAKPHWQGRHDPAEQADLAYNQSTVGARLTFDELLRVVVPLSGWWQKYVEPSMPDIHALLGEQTARVAAALADPEEAARSLTDPGLSEETRRNLPDLLWMVRIVGALALARQGDLRFVQKPRRNARLDWEELVQAVADLMIDRVAMAEDEEPYLYSVNRNRPASVTVYRSTLAVKADAARLLFNVSCRELAWAVVDSGIDATHPAFRKRQPPATPEEAAGGGKLLPDPFRDEKGKPGNGTRVVATYDFTRIRELLNPDNLTPDQLPEALRKRLDAGDPEARRFVEEDLGDLQLHLQRGREINWDLLEPLLRVPQQEGIYTRPKSEHGTHVAGILAGDWRAGDPGRAKQESLQGMCPDLRLYDCRVLDDQGEGDEFAVIAALQFIRHLNAHKDYIVIHGANLSLSIRHDVSNYACGATPVCEESERLVGAGVVVVAAAGNLGWRKVESLDGQATEGYSSISITDPGNAEGVITVGATHRFQPHTYGVSYFSSRGPTGDGRLKPDLVAPGEKIEAPVPGEVSRPKDGTSMAAPHVSGAAALLIARHRELAGKPVRIKRILCETATDLGRERYFQGRGMVDVLRALQSV
ncbi:MAG TPA: S8 family serine peptidase [Thermoanaerobaculia bacterium]|nr:S8 family serine peptidase [Thermoanaerobaculia bacterium]